MKLKIKHALNKISTFIIFLSVIVIFIHFLYTFDLIRRQQSLNKEIGKFILTLLDERVNALNDDDTFINTDIIISVSDYFDLEYMAEVLVFESGSGKILYPIGVMEDYVNQDIINKTRTGLEGTIDIKDRLGYFIQYKKLGITFIVYAYKSDLYFYRNQLIYIVIGLLVVFSIILFIIDRRVRKKLRIVLNKMKICFESAFIKGKLLEAIEPQDASEIDDVLESYNQMVLKAGDVFKSMESRTSVLFQQRDNLKKIISLYKQYVRNEIVLKISEKNISDLVSRRQNISSLSIELVNFLRPIDELYPQVITGELSSLHAFLKNEAMNNGGIINFSYGYFINVVYGVPTPDEISFSHALEGSKSLLRWIGERNSSEKNISGVKWEVKMGLSFGAAVTGTVGDSYVVLGNVVEESMKMLDFAKYYGVPIVTSSLDRLESLEGVKYRKLDYIIEKTEKERHKKIIYEIFLKQPEQLEDAIKLYYHGLDMFFDGKYDIAVYEFKKVNKILDGDNPSYIFLKRCERFSKGG